MSGGLKWNRGPTRNPVTGLSRGQLRTRLVAGTDFAALNDALAAMELDVEDDDQAQDPEPCSVADDC